MEQQLAERLFQYITVNNPDLLFNLQADRHVSVYIRDKVKSVEALIEQLRSTATPDYLIEEQCFALLTEDLRPSRFMYIKNVLETEFEERAAKMRECGVMTYEICSLITHCDPVFTALDFSVSTQEERAIYNAITGSLAEFFERPGKSVTDVL